MSRTTVLLLALLAAVGVSCGARDPSLPGSGSNPGPAVPGLSGSALLRGYALAETNLTFSGEHYALTNRDRTVVVNVVRGLDAEGAGQLLREGVMGIEALYANALSPYPGDISNQVVSDPRYRPRRLHRTHQGSTNTLFILFANERLGYGVTTADAVKFKSVLGWLYCPGGEAGAGAFYKIRCFGPLGTADDELERVFDAFGCGTSPAH